MDILIPKLYKEYGQYINSFRSFPLDVDGLKPAERRVLLSAHQIARSKLVKSAKIDGYTIGNFHPHGSVYGTIVQLVHQGFLEGQGNFGANFGVQPIGPAAMRYTEARLSRFIKEIAFKYVEHVNWNTNDLDEKEPEFLPTMFPLCFCGTEYTQGIGFGYRTLIPCFRVEDLYKRLLWVLKIEKTEPIIKPITGCTITATNAELKTLLTTGKSVISVKGVIKTIPLQCKVILKSWPAGKRFESILGKLSKELDNGDIGFTDSSVTDTEIVFEVLKQRSRDVIYKKFLKTLREAVKGSISFENNVVDVNQNVKLKSIDQMLLTTYSMFTQVRKQVFRRQIQDVKAQILELKILEKIRPSLSTVLRNKLPENQAITKISKTTKVSEIDIRYLFGKYRISKLLNMSIETTTLNTEVNSLTSDLNNITNVVLNHYNELFE